MSSVLGKNVCLVLNKCWQAVGIRTPEETFPMLMTDAACALDIATDNHLVPCKWADWVKLPVRDQDYAIKTVRGDIRVPTVIVLCNYAKVPKTRPRFSLRTLGARDGWRCQYTGRELKPHEASIDHVIPRSRGGGTTWENCVLAEKKVNFAKADMTPDEAGMKLLTKPKAPQAVPVSFSIKNAHQVKDWEIFLTS